MKKWLKRIRGVIGMGLSWAAGLGGVGAIFILMTDTFSLGAFLIGAATYAALGFLGGATFSVVLGIVEGRHRFDQMSLPRFAAWGAVGGFLVSISLFTLGSGFELGELVGVGLGAFLGAGCAAGSLALARRSDDRELLEHGADVADIGLTEEERRELLAG